MVELMEEDQEEQTQPEGDEPADRMRMRVILRTTDFDVAEEYLRGVPGVTDVIHITGIKCNPGGRFEVTFKDMASQYRFQYEEAERPPLPEQVKQIVHVSRPISREKRIFLAQILSYRTSKQWQRVLAYIHCNSSVAGFERQVLLTDLPADLVMDPDLESSYRKMLKILAASEVEFEWARYFKAADFRERDPFQLVLQFADVEQARAFTANTQLRFEGRPFSGVLMSTLKADKETVEQQALKEVSANEHGVMAISRGPNADKPQDLLEKLFPGELDSWEPYPTIFTHIHQAGVGIYQLKFKAQFKAVEEMARLEQTRWKHGQEPNIMVLLLASDFLDWLNIKQTTMQARAQPTAALRVEGNKFVFSLPTAPEKAARGIEMAGKKNPLDSYVACTCLHFPTTWTPKEIKEITSFFTDHHGPFTDVTVLNGVLYLGFPSAKAAEQFQGMSYCLYKGKKVVRKRFIPTEPVWKDPTVQKTLADKLTAARSQPLSGKKAVAQQQPAKKREVPVAPPQVKTVCHFNRGMTLTGFRDKATNAEVKEKLATEFGVADEEFTSGAWLQTDGNWACRVIMRERPRKKLRSLIDRWNWKKVIIGGGIIKAEIYETMDAPTRKKVKTGKGAASSATVSNAADTATKRSHEEGEGAENGAGGKPSKKAKKQFQDFIANY